MKMFGSWCRNWVKGEYFVRYTHFGSDSESVRAVRWKCVLFSIIEELSVGTAESSFNLMFQNSFQVTGITDSCQV
jgi:hypothetical protein